MALNPEIAGVLRDINAQIGGDLDSAISDFERTSDSGVAAPDDAPANERGPVLAPVTVRRFAAFLVFGGIVAAAIVIATAWVDGSDQSDPAPNLAMTEDRTQPTQRVVVDGDTMYLEGLVPDQAVSERFESAAVAAVGRQRVVNNFRVSEQAIYDPGSPIRISAAAPVLFRSGAASLDDRYRPLLDLAADLMTAEPTSTLAITGHTDDIGPEDRNLRLSIARAESAARLVVQRGIDADRLTVDGRGETEPIDTNETYNGRAVNRRVEFSMLGIFQH